MANLRARDLAAPLVLATGAVLASRAASAFINARFPDRPEPRDLLLEIVPYVHSAQYVADAAVLLAMLVLLVHLVRRAPAQTPGVLAMFAVLYILRAVLITLTPLAAPHGSEVFGFMPPQSGMFPSGHSANTWLCFLVVNGEMAPRIKFLALGIALAELCALLLSRGHYSIDIVGGLLLAYFVWREWTIGRVFGPVKRLVGGE